MPAHRIRLQAVIVEPRVADGPIWRNLSRQFEDRAAVKRTANFGDAVKISCLVHHKPMHITAIKTVPLTFRAEAVNIREALELKDNSAPQALIIVIVATPEKRGAEQIAKRVDQQAFDGILASAQSATETACKAS